MHHDEKFSLDKRVVERAKKLCADMLEHEEEFFAEFNEPDKAKQACKAVLERLENMSVELPFGLGRAISRGEGPKGFKRLKRRRDERKRRYRRKS